MPLLTDTLDFDGETWVPEPTDADREWARANPGKWRYYLDPAVEESQARWPFNFMCGWPVNDSGEIGPMWLNPDFVPVPETADMELTSEFELVLWRTMRGFTAFGPFIDLFSRHRFLTLLPDDDPSGQRGWPVREERYGPEMTVYTSPAQLPKDVNPWLRREVSGRELIEQVCPREGIRLNVNPGGQSMMSIPGEDLVDLWRQWLEHSPTAPEVG